MTPATIAGLQLDDKCKEKEEAASSLPKAPQTKEKSKIGNDNKAPTPSVSKPTITVETPKPENAPPPSMRSKLTGKQRTGWI